MEQVEIRGEVLTLLGERAMCWDAQKTLIIADLHLGKINHFRRAGIPAPQKANDSNVDRLLSLLQSTKPERVLLLGDLFHSSYNSEWEVFGQVVKAFPATRFELVLGNHDIMSRYQYEKHGIILHDEELKLGSFIFTHDLLKEESELFNIAGHIHPGVRLRGKGRQFLRLPCFYFNDTHGLMPAFGEFTGLYQLKPKETDRIFVIAEKDVIDVSKQLS